MSSFPEDLPNLSQEELLEVIAKLGKIIDYLLAYNRYLKSGPPRATIEVVKIEPK